MGAKLRRFVADAVWWVLEVLVSMLLGAFVFGIGGLALGFLSDGVDAFEALQVKPSQE